MGTTIRATPSRGATVGTTIGASVARYTAVAHGAGAALYIGVGGGTGKATGRFAMGGDDTNLERMPPP